MRCLGRGSLLIAAAATLSVLVVACHGNEGRPAERPRPSLVSEAASLPAFVTPAVWRYHPPQPARINATLELPSGDKVLAGRRGERWLLAKSSGLLEAASVLAPEELVGILQSPTGQLVFVGASGVSYEAPSAIAPFTRSSAPLEPLTSVSSAGGAIVGIRRDRGLLRSDDGGTTWKAVGPTGPKFVSVVLGESGNGLGLAAPEALYETHDAGQTFTQLALKSVGAFSLERAEQSFGVTAALGTFRYKPGATELESVKPGASATGRDLKGPRGPDARALTEGRAAVAGGTYYELGLRDKGGWQLISGPWSGPLALRDLPELSACRAVRLTAFERGLRVACFRGGAEAVTQPIELWSSDDAGRTLHSEGVAVDGNLAAFRMALGADGTLLLAGVCASYASGAGCAPQGIARRSKSDPNTGHGKAGRAELGSAATPSLAETALGLAFSVDGRIAYAVGRRTKGGVLAVFVSRDAGKSFEAQDLSLPTGDGSEDEERWESSASGVKVDALVPAEDGSVGIAVSRYRSRVWLVLDETGRVLSVARPPESRALLGVAGSRALSVSSATNEVWESLDGGATFQSLGKLPIDLCVNDSNCDAQIACVPGGCAVGQEMSRLGWGGQGEDDTWMQPAIAPAPVDYSVPRLKAPITCTLDSSPWQALEGVSEYPTAFQSAIGKAAWFAAGDDPARAGAWMWVASSGSRPRVERQVLLAPHERGRAFALAVSDQVEGVAAIRYLVPDGSGTSHLTSAEIGWSNLFEGSGARHVSIGDGGAYLPGDFSRNPRGFQEADPALLSIAEGGLYLRIHHSPGDLQPTLFFDGKQSETIAPVTWPTVGVRGSHSEMAHVDGKHVPLLLVGRGAAVVRARPATVGGSNNELEAFATGVLDPARFGLAQGANIAYSGLRAGQVIETLDTASARAQAKLFLFRAQGDVLDPPIDVPTQLSLGEKSERCTAGVEGQTPRVVAAPYPGTRHPVIVSDGGDTPQAFLTSYAVLHGTPDAACVSTFDAEPVAAEGGAPPPSRLVLPMTDLAHAYIFRATLQGNEARMDYHAIACKVDPNAEVPPELYRAPGTLVPRAR